MKSDSVLDGLLLSALAAVPLFFLSFFAVFSLGSLPAGNPVNATLFVLTLLLPFIVYWGGAACFAIVHRERMAEGVAIGGTVASAAIVGFILFLAVMASAVAEA